MKDQIRLVLGRRYRPILSAALIAARIPFAAKIALTCARSCAASGHASPPCTCPEV